MTIHGRIHMIHVQERAWAKIAKDIGEGDRQFGKNDSGDPKQKTQKRSVSSSSVPSVNNPKRNKTTPNQISLADVNKSALNFLKKRSKHRINHLLSLMMMPMCSFLLSLLPDLKKMTDKQKRKYKVGVLNLAGEILDEPVVSSYLCTSLLPQRLVIIACCRQHTFYPFLFSMYQLYSTSM
ncbi:unnamed protein product [Acanthoscelides obtectus]|uniref:BESS domain-containing protein n=1 Tax=Acanthoscelides obtectus TaxID=200917 RepID=A0A9P0PQ74_ACAOB|nr:unnamed protein product [Acanthoscelides obtectus]CAK1624889.1 hypothetical protein AOBTE_LOCUS2828 [Acanthoscelides obtectus]